jgi:pimeloyl-ACP methyl ester carboxylesterase
VLSGGRLSMVGGDRARMSPDLAALFEEELGRLRDRPERLPAAVTAFASVVSAMYVHPDRVRRAVDAAPPALLLYGDEDPLADPSPRRPDWRIDVVAGAGHLLPMEVPDLYVDRVGRWLAALPRD